MQSGHGYPAASASGAKNDERISTGNPPLPWQVGQITLRPLANLLQSTHARCGSGIVMGATEPATARHTGRTHARRRPCETGRRTATAGRPHHWRPRGWGHRLRWQHRRTRRHCRRSSPALRRPNVHRNVRVLLTVPLATTAATIEPPGTGWPFGAAAVFELELSVMAWMQLRIMLMHRFAYYLLFSRTALSAMMAEDMTDSVMVMLRLDVGLKTAM